MTDGAKLRLFRALKTVRSGLGVSVEDMLAAAFVAAPFAGTFGIWLSALTWWPSPVIWLPTALAQAAGTLWIAGRRRAAGSEQ